MQGPARSLNGQHISDFFDLWIQLLFDCGFELLELGEEGFRRRIHYTGGLSATDSIDDIVQEFKTTDEQADLALESGLGGKQVDIKEGRWGATKTKLLGSLKGCLIAAVDHVAQIAKIETV